MSDDTATSEGRRLIEAWDAARKAEVDTEIALKRARSALINAELALGKWLLPHDAKPGEKIAVWHRDRLIQAEVREHSAPIISERRREAKR